mmetsp:Transcript_172503/g.547668  ORF Transcript_172503/g.547668 Transcript_172503/m.547668 type:complete len:92 (+) Transcript_172503:332-607(+)
MAVVSELSEMKRLVVATLRAEDSDVLPMVGLTASEMSLQQHRITLLDFMRRQLGNIVRDLAADARSAIEVAASRVPWKPLRDMLQRFGFFS